MAEYRIRNITFSLAGVDLTGDGVIAFSAPGQCDVDIVALIQRTAVSVSFKGNASQQVTISVLKKFANDTALEQFAISHFGALTKAGALTVTAGSVTRTATTAAIQSVVTAEPEALLLVVTYSIICSPLL